MRQQSSFSGWDFPEVWGIAENQTYPYLRISNPVGDIDLNGSVDLLDLIHLASHWLEGTIP